MQVHLLFNGWWHTDVPLKALSTMSNIQKTIPTISDKLNSYIVAEHLTAEALGNLRRNTRKVEILGKVRNAIRPGDLYPGIWGWDAAFHAIGLAHQSGLDGLNELENSSLGQTEEGMIPSILFYDEEQANRDYYPGPNVWENFSKSELHISGISQPPVFGFALKRVLEIDPTCKGHKDKIKNLFNVAYDYHKWWYEHRDPQGNGLVVTIHPWETGRDNAVEWDVAKNNIRQTQEYKDFEFDPSVRKDNKSKEVNPEHRPRDEAYKMFIYLLDDVKKTGYSIKNSDGSYRDDLPFCLQDVTINSFLMTSNEALIELADEFGSPSQKEQLLAWHALTKESYSILWNEEAGSFQSKNILSGNLTKTTNASYMAMASNITSKEQALSMSRIIHKWRDAHHIKFGVPSTSPEHPSFEAERYWRGPTWSIVNYVIVYGFIHQAKRYRCPSLIDMAADMLMETLDLIQQDPEFHEYHNPINGKGCGAKHFGFTSVAFLELQDMIIDMKKW